MKAILTIPAAVSIAIFCALYSKISDPKLFRDLEITMIFMPFLVFPASLCGLFLLFKKESKISPKIGLGALHLAGLATASPFAYEWCHFLFVGIPAQR